MLKYHMNGESMELAETSKVESQVKSQSNKKPVEGV